MIGKNYFYFICSFSFLRRPFSCKIERFTYKITFCFFCYFIKKFWYSSFRVEYCYFSCAFICNCKLKSTSYIGCTKTKITYLIKLKLLCCLEYFRTWFKLNYSSSTGVRTFPNEYLCLNTLPSRCTVTIASSDNAQTALHPIP